MSSDWDRYRIVSVDGTYEIWTRTITFDYEGIRYCVSLDYHEREGLSWKWFDESENEIAGPTWLTDDDFDFYWDLGQRARGW